MQFSRLIPSRKDFKSIRGGFVSTSFAWILLAILACIFTSVSVIKFNLKNNIDDESNQVTSPKHQENLPGSVDRSRTKFEVFIRKPAGPPRVDTGLTNFHGEAVTIACSTCHSVRSPDFENKTTEHLDEFHGSLTVSHGAISCLSCHNSNDYDSLKLADGNRIEFINVMKLCGQCHGPQLNDYNRGVHGGMNGFWDLNRGPQTKNNCVDCHNPHTPKFPKMKPTFKPRDRFLNEESH